LAPLARGRGDHVGHAPRVFLRRKVVEPAFSVLLEHLSGKGPGLDELELGAVEALDLLEPLRIEVRDPLDLHLLPHLGHQVDECGGPVHLGGHQGRDEPHHHHDPGKHVHDVGIHTNDGPQVAKPFGDLGVLRLRTHRKLLFMR